MGTDDKYRRITDEPSRLLIILNERVEALTRAVEKLTDKQLENPCKTHDLRLRYLERIVWGIVAATALLTLKTAFSFFASVPLP